MLSTVIAFFFILRDSDLDERKANPIGFLYPQLLTEWDQVWCGDEAIELEYPKAPFIGIYVIKGNKCCFPDYITKCSRWRAFGRLWTDLVQPLYDDRYHWILSFYFLSYLSYSLADRWDTTVDFTTSFLHSSRFSAFHSIILHSRPVHSLMLSSHRFLRLSLRLRPWTDSSRIVLVSPDDRVTCPYHFSSRLFIEVWRSLYDPVAFPILPFTSSLVMWSL